MDDKPKLVWRNSLTDEPLEDELELPERPQEPSYEEEIRLRVLDDQQPY